MRAGWPRITPLFFSCRPSDIPRLVVAVIVNSIKRVACFAIVGKLKNVVIERLKIMPPLIANADTAATVVFVLLKVGSSAAIIHAAPNSIQPMVTQAVFGVSRQKLIVRKASARLGASALQMGRINSYLVAAIALTKPRLAPTNAFSESYRHQSPKSQVGEIFRATVTGDEASRLPLRVTAHLLIGWGNCGFLSASALTLAVRLQQPVHGNPRGIIGYVVGKVWSMIGVHRNSPFLCLIRGRVTSTLPGLFACSTPVSIAQKGYSSQ